LSLVTARSGVHHQDSIRFSYRCFDRILLNVRYDLSKLRAKGLVERVPHSRRYRLLPHGYSTCLVFLKLFERVYAPLTAGLLKPVTADRRLAEEQHHRLDRLYHRIVIDLDGSLTLSA
jgi:hypothetical protein